MVFQRSRLRLPRNNGRKACKAFFLYSIFCRLFVFFCILGFFCIFLLRRLLKGELPFAGAGLRQCQLDGMVHQIENIVLVGEAHLGFGRVNIDIHKVGRHLKKQNSSRELALHRSAFERHLHARHHGAVADVAAVDVEILHTPAGAAALGLGDETMDPVGPLGVVHLHKTPGKLPPQHRIGCAPQGTIAGRNVLQFSLPDKLEADFRMAECHMADNVGHKGALAGILFEELHPGGRVVEEIPHPDGGARASGTRLDGLLFPALDPIN